MESGKKARKRGNRLKKGKELCRGDDV